MSTPPQQAYRSEPETELSPQRIDERSRQIVNKGISVQSSFSTICAIEYLKSHNVDAEVIERVLLRPDLRRKIH